jgi:hypothetical protein
MVGWPWRAGFSDLLGTDAGDIGIFSWLPNLTMTTPESIAETRLQSYQRLSDKDKTADLLRALLQCAPSPNGRTNVAAEINSCVEDYQLSVLSQRYLHGLLVPSRSSFPYMRLAYFGNSPSARREDTGNFTPPVTTLGRD